MSAIVNQLDVAPPEAPVFEDPDQKALADAEAALAAEGGQVPASPAPPVAPAAAPAAQPAVAGQPPAPAAAPVPEAAMVPVAVAAGLRQKLREARDALVYRQGENETLRTLIASGAMAPPAAAARVPQATPQEQILAERNRVKEASRKFDAAEITAEQLEDARAAADDRIWAIRTEQSQAAARAAQPKPAPAPAAAQPTPSIGLADQQVLEQKVTEIQGSHPWTADASPITDDQWAWLANLGRQELRAQGVDVDAMNVAQGTLLLRERVAELADMYGPRWHKNWTPPATPAAAPAAVPATVPGQATAPMSPAAKARLDALNTAAAMPPDVNTIGQQAPVGAVFTDSEIDSMPADALTKLMDAKDPRLGAFLVTS